MPFPVFRRRNKSKGEKDGVSKKQEGEAVVVLPLENPNDDVQAIANETHHLLERITTVSPSRKRPRKVVGRVTIEVLDTFPPSARLEESSTNAAKDKRNPAIEPPFAVAPLDTGDAFGFDEEESRVREAADIFVPSTIPGKKALEEQLDVLDHEKDRLSRQRTAHESIHPLVLPAPEVESGNSPQTRSKDRETLAAIKIQASGRGFLVRRRQFERQVSPGKHEDESIKAKLHAIQAAWREITDPDRGETWYYNTETGQSQWEPPVAMTAAASPLPPLSKASSTKGMSTMGAQALSPAPHNNNQGHFSSLPPLSPKTQTPHSCAVSMQVAAKSHTLPVLTPQPPMILVQDFDDDIPSTMASVTQSNSPSTSSGQSNSAPCSHSQPHTSPPNHHPADSACDGEMVDWMDDTALFLADGSKNHKLRDTIRDALKVSKFDSVSSLLTSSISFNAKRDKYRRPDRTGELSPSLASSGVARDVVLGKKPDTYMVAVLAKDKGSSSHKKKSAKPPPATRHLRIRDVADSGFSAQNVARSPPKQRPRSSSGPSDKDALPTMTQCFACWSAIKGCLCEKHQDPYDTRARPASESALMCSNWEIDQLRRKYRAEEIQEVFMKANSSLRYDKQRKAYITVIECRHPIYRAVDATLSAFNKTMRRKLHTRAWFRSFLEQLRLGNVSKASPPTLLKLRDTLRNGKWCQAYSDSVVHFHPVAPVTQRSFSPNPTLDVIAMSPSAPHDLRQWVLQTVCPVPKVLYLPRTYELLPRRCIPMPQPSFLDQIPLPVPNRFIDGRDKISWVERLCARQSQASLYRAMAQIKACTPAVGFDKPRRTRVTPPSCVLFANFGRKPTADNVAVGGLVAELLIYLVVTTFVPPQFGNFTVTDRRSICPKPTPDSSAVYKCFEIAATTFKYVVRPLEHALNTRRPPTIMVVVQGEAVEPCVNRPEQTSEEAFFGFRTILEWMGLDIPDETRAVTFVPSGDVLTFNTPAFNATITTRADRYYPFCEPTTRESTIAEFIHLLWMGKSTRNQPQCFTNLGSQDPGEFMKNCNVDGAMGQCIPIIYRSWAFMQGSPFEEFVTDDGLAYWYDKRTGITYWERPLMDQEKHRGDDGDIEGVVVDGRTEKATVGVGGGGADARYSQQDMRKYLTKTMESPMERDARVKSVRISAQKHSIVLKPDVVVVKEPPPPRMSRIQVPPLSFQPTLTKPTTGNGPLATTTTAGAPPRVGENASSPFHAVKPPVATTGPVVNEETKKLIDTLTQALGASMGQTNVLDVLQLGIGLGMGLGMKGSSLLEEAKSEDSASDGDDLPSTQAIPSRGSIHASAADDLGATTTRTEISVVLDATPDELPPGERVPHPFGTEFVTHPPPGEGVTWVDQPVDFSEESQTAVDGFRGAVHRSVAVLPRNFVQCATTTKTVKMEANYLPSLNNKNQPRSMGIVRPRTAADEWLTVGYDPWVAGKDLFNCEFVKSLAVEDNDTPAVAGSAFIDANEHAARQEVATQAAKEAMELEHIFSLCRHGKYAEVENLLNQPDWTVPIDAKDNAGNTLLSIACQNNNKRIAKLCLRKGADVNTQNLNGQTVLHYTHAYGFHDLMEYMMEKGAKDDVVNKDGLTCYEGLNAEAVDAI
ncbi:hypothetical protein H310_09843 [Aphanomyces invadans]|uniref:WW domain-containing protein n=1 Tax=Aphanomyces invadans TaxID=157072 RepID=A0A024TS77_9STRA|nr:hypothetical protein H310_09843 [Aphanomyces invadans]ETV96995.1 hypothetical protein H310_09843 [Aphanomyces invadans]|eukprot:XP_008874241.1 hypothetical protein H310_09843 [Aphanomyces invadans]